MSIHISGTGGEREIEADIWNMLLSLGDFPGHKQDFSDEESSQLADKIAYSLGGPPGEIRDDVLRNYIEKFGNGGLLNYLDYFRLGSFSIRSD